MAPFSSLFNGWAPAGIIAWKNSLNGLLNDNGQKDSIEALTISGKEIGLSGTILETFFQNIFCLFNDRSIYSSFISIHWSAWKNDNQCTQAKKKRAFCVNKKKPVDLRHFCNFKTCLEAIFAYACNTVYILYCHNSLYLC